MKKGFYILSWVAIISFIFLTVLITYWLTWPYKIATQNGEAKALTPIVKNGESLQYVLDYCKYTDIVPIKARRQLVDGLIYPLPTTPPRALPRGCQKIIASTPVITPDCTECFDRQVHLEITAVYQVNPLRTKEVTFITELFTIIK